MCKMLPSGGYFKEINCPFFDNGLCQRPYCHFRHTKKDPHNNASDGIENGTILQRLVTEAVKKVFQKTETSQTDNSPSVSTELESVQVSNPSIVTQGKATYNPTPISELEKKDSGENDVQPRRHIPVPYTPYRPAAVPIKRNETVIKKDSEQKNIFTLASSEIIKYNPGTGSSKHDPYQPEGSSQSNGIYLPGSKAEVPTYSPSVSNSHPNSAVYVPSDPSTIAVSRKERLKYEPVSVNKSVSSNKIEYNPTLASKTSSGKMQLLYEPEPVKKPKYPCFSSDEEEPQMKKTKIDEINENLNDLDDLETEFDILGQILEEEKNENSSENKNGRKLLSCKKSDKSSTKSDDKKSSRTSSKEKRNEKVKSSSDSSKDNHKDHKDKTKYKDNEEKTISKSSSTSKHGTTSSKQDKHSPKTKDKHKICVKKKEEEEKVKDKHKETDRHDKHKKSSKSKSSERSSKNSSSTSKSSSKHHSKTDISDKDPTSGKRKDAKNKFPKQTKIHFDGDLKNESNDNDSGNENDYDGLEEQTNELSDSEEDDVTRECMKIFEEYTPITINTSIAQPNKVHQPESKEEIIIPTKKRISHSTSISESILPKRVLKPDHAMQAAQVMANRLQKIREYHTSKAAATMNSYGAQSLGTTRTDTGSQPTPGSKVRISYVPNVSTLLNAKKTLPIRPAAAKSEPSCSTTVQTLPRGSSRVAHMPSEKFSDRPGVLEPLSSRIPANVRSTYLNMMIDECLKIYLVHTDAYARAQQEELATCRKCKALQIYKNSAVLTVSRLRKELSEAGGVKKGSEATPSCISHNDVLLGKAGLTSSWSVLKNKNSTSDIKNCLQGPKFYELISRWVLTEEQLQEHGFPRPHPSGERGRAKIYIENKTKPPKGNVRRCRRCNKEYMVDKKCFPIRKEDCIYHPNRKYTFRGESKYQCCSQDGMSDGCMAAPTHVYEYVDFDCLKGFVTTMPKECEGETYGVYALDCEMCYTTHGLDLTRLTVIDSSFKTVYETLIRPLHPIIDFNTTFSGITEESMRGVTTTLLEVQATLLHMFSDKTILVGHSLESDFKVLKLIHNTVVDTSILFPHRRGPPFKRALRNLTSEYLNKIIQNSVGGHDSAEDAMVCMELLQWKLKEEFKIR